MKHFFSSLILFVSIFCFFITSGCSSPEKIQSNIEERHELRNECYTSVDQIFSLSFENTGNFQSQLQTSLFICKDHQFKMQKFSSYDEEILLQTPWNKLLDLEVDFLDFLDKNQEIFLTLLQPLEDLSKKELSDQNYVFTQFMQRFLSYEEDIDKAYHEVLDMQTQFLKKYELDHLFD